MHQSIPPVPSTARPPVGAGVGAAGMGLIAFKTQSLTPLPVEDQLNSSGVSIKIENFFRDKVK